ncbi:hypothetical protein AUC69_07150 [Methyloceanibacter superfactus]|uniref:Porin domain-containing protein n=1 Tax=Methyloceanibacter superfactus TaxID=1774969 RepID=A0A1E3W618_9HYPH|nr:hypothetical protein AUC69_07150 [Methyloceanibacter superfactus]
MALPAQAGDNEIALSATTNFTTDYVFRGISQTREGPAAQAEFDLTYGIFYAGIWGSNVDFGGSGFGDDIASIEIDYYAGIAPTWQGISFDIAGLYYTYPGAYDPAGNFDYFELKTGASYTFNEALTLGVANYWSPEFFGETGDATRSSSRPNTRSLASCSISSRPASAAGSVGSGRNSPTTPSGMPA